MLSLDDTICAIASAPGGAARGIVRLSGPDVVAILSRCCDPFAEANVASMIAGHIDLGRPLGRVPVDLYLWPNNRSYTRQPTAELHLFGSPPLLAAAVQTLCAHGARPAEPGEFTLRAFLAGRLDLTQAEAVLGVIDAVGRKPLEAALAQLAGGMSRPLASLREQLLELLAHLEAGLDFVEEDIEFVSATTVDQTLKEARQAIEDLLQQLTSRATTSDLPRVVLVGLPNVGKSSLFNALIGRTSAIVANQPGTTRDYLTATIHSDGIQYELIDTAGIDQSTVLAEIEHAAQQASASQRDAAQITLFCFDSTRPLEMIEKEWLAAAASSAFRTPNIFVLTKCDLPQAMLSVRDAIHTSSSSGTGLAELNQAIKQSLASLQHDTAVTGTAERCQDSLQSATESLSRAQSLNSHRSGEELIALEIRLALTELGKVVGAVYTDDILDRIFSRFCIGK